MNPAPRNQFDAWEDGLLEASRLIRAELLARHAGHAAFEGDEATAADFMTERARLMATTVAAELTAASTTKKIDTIRSAAAWSASRCQETGCSKNAVVRGYCNPHYSRKIRSGEISKIKGDARGFLQSVVLQYQGDECILWPFSTDRNGYAQMRVGGRSRIVSRMVCESANGPPPTPSHVAAHSCGRGYDGCVTRRHLSWKTRSENEADKIAHGTVVRGDRSNFAKLSEAEARQILAAKGKSTQREIAERFGIDPSTVSVIHAGKAWAWLNEEVLS